MTDTKLSFLLPKALHRRLVRYQRAHAELRTLTSALVRVISAGLDALDTEARP
jgi:hypothetical protein